MNEIEELEDAADYARQAYLNTDLVFKTSREARKAREAARIRMFNSARALDNATDKTEDK